MTHAPPQKTLIRPTAIVLSALGAGMLGMAYASVPLYRLFCQKTGYGGTPQVVFQKPTTSAERSLRLSFNTDVAPHLPWAFRALQHAVTFKLGTLQTVHFEVHNRSSDPITGMAIYNVTPDKVGLYFKKMDCFCFEAQTLQPGEKRVMPLVFFLDASMDQDPLLKDVKAVTLSYTFFKLPPHVQSQGRLSLQHATNPLHALKKSAK